MRVLATPPEHFRGWHNGMWRPWYAAVWAEAAVLAGDAEAGERLLRARWATAGNPDVRWPPADHREVASVSRSHPDRTNHGSASDHRLQPLRRPCVLPAQPAAARRRDLPGCPATAYGCPAAYSGPAARGDRGGGSAAAGCCGGGSSSACLPRGEDQSVRMLSARWLSAHLDVGCRPELPTRLDAIWTSS